MSIVIHQHAYGGPEALTVEHETVGEPGPGEVRLHQHAIGVNFIDLAFRAGAIPGPGFPLTLGVEGAGEVAAVGPGVTGFAPGDRVAYTLVPGAYAEERIVPAAMLLRLPDDVPFELAAAVTTKGLLAGALVDRVARLSAGDVALVHAAAGGVGSLITRWATARGVAVIGTVGSPAKVAAARAAGADPVLVLGSGDLAAEVLRRTGSRGVTAVLDGVGAATADLSLRAVAEGGSLVRFGNSSGPADLDERSVAAKRVRVSTPDLGGTVPDPAERQAIADELFALLSGGPAPRFTTYKLTEVADAHRDLESRRSTGSLVLTA
ncbi:quinone oxidoreductase [Asanoa sp. NPDC050611]|uniref:quinone oxidoreductase family protein n=1 Tax=Asanoa sp. NPDC050611 TaxID=3157098 RepID=UPI00340C9368